MSSSADRKAPATLSTIDSIVLDVGASKTKFGFAGFPAPHEFPSVVGYRQGTNGQPDETILGDVRLNSNMFGSACAKLVPSSGPTLSLDQFNEDAWQKTVEFALQQLGEHNFPIMLTESLVEGSDVKQRKAEILFETIGAPAMHSVLSCALPAFAAGRHTALVVESGATYTQVAAVVDGFVLRESSFVSTLAGNAVTANFRELLNIQAHSNDALLPPGNAQMNWREWRSFCRAEGMKTIYCSAIPDNNVQSQGETFDLPDGSQVVIGKATSAAEILFDTSPTSPMGANLRQCFMDQAIFAPGPIPHSDLILPATNPSMLPQNMIAQLGLSQPRAGSPRASPQTGMPVSIPAMAGAIVAQQADRVARDILGAVILSGGCCDISGFEQRFLSELQAYVPSVMRVSHQNSRITQLPGSAGRRMHVWRGGSILASSAAFQSVWTTVDDWREIGPSVLEKHSF